MSLFIHPVSTQTIIEDHHDEDFLNSMPQTFEDNKQKMPLSSPAPIAPKKFLTNQGDNTLSKRLEKILPMTHDFDCLVGYFFISGFFRLYPALEPVAKIRILIGLMNEQVIHGLIQIA